MQEINPVIYYFSCIKAIFVIIYWFYIIANKFHVRSGKYHKQSAFNQTFKGFRKGNWEYRQKYFDFEETKVNGSCGLYNYHNFGEWLNLVRSIEKDKLVNNLHTSTFFLYVKKTAKL